MASDAQIYQPDLVERPATRMYRGRIYWPRICDGRDPAAGGDDFWCSIVMDVTRVPYRVNVFRMRHKSSDFCIKQIIEQAEDFALQK